MIYFLTILSVCAFLFVFHLIYIFARRMHHFLAEFHAKMDQQKEINNELKNLAYNGASEKVNALADYCEKTFVRKEKD